MSNASGPRLPDRSGSVVDLFDPSRVSNAAGSSLGELGTFLIFAQRVLYYTVVDIIFRRKYLNEVVKQISDVVAFVVVASKPGAR